MKAVVEAYNSNWLG